MNKAFLYIIFLISVWSFSYAQTNLVYNGSFEEYSQCPNLTSQPGADQLYALGWYSPTFATTDYFNSCDVTQHVGVPQNFIGYEHAHSGNAYVGVVYISRRNNTIGMVDYNYGEYLQTKLSSSLMQNRLYKIQLFVSRADAALGYIDTIGVAGIAIDHIGILFTDDSLTAPITDFFPNVPSVETESGILLEDSVGWAEINLYYLADGSEEYMTIGFFKDINSVAAGYYIHDFITNDLIETYYYIDDVSIVEVDEITYPNIFTPNGDNINDFLIIKMPPGFMGTLIIYNRWGTVVYKQEGNMFSWNGKNALGSECTDGVYFYILEGKKIKQQKGFIQLVR